MITSIELEGNRIDIPSTKGVYFIEADFKTYGPFGTIDFSEKLHKFIEFIKNYRVIGKNEFTGSNKISTDKYTLEIVIEDGLILEESIYSPDSKELWAFIGAGQPQILMEYKYLENNNWFNFGYMKLFSPPKEPWTVSNFLTWGLRDLKLDFFKYGNYKLNLQDERNVNLLKDLLINLDLTYDIDEDFNFKASQNSDVWLSLENQSSGTRYATYLINKLLNIQGDTLIIFDPYPNLLHKLVEKAIWNYFNEKTSKQILVFGYVEGFKRVLINPKTLINGK